MSDTMRVMVVNVGSSSLKMSVLDGSDQVISSHEISAPDGKFDRNELRDAVADHSGFVDAVGHRVVHGGEKFNSPVRIDDHALQAISELVALAPLHQQTSLDAIELVARLLPRTPAVACFDTAFHATLPPAARTYALPRAWRENWRVRRYGFHGLSHDYVSRRASELAGVPLEKSRVVACHLGAGASLAAVQSGRSVDTTMGFTPLEGLVMANRSGSVDPGILVWLLESGRVDLPELSRALEHDSGLAGLAGTGDMRAIINSARDGDSDAALAIDVYVHRLRASIAAMAAAMGGLDVLAFSGGVGEHVPEIRAAAVSTLEMFGMQIDPAANGAGEVDSIVSPSDSPVAVVVVRAREDITIARGVRMLLGPLVADKSESGA